MRLTQAMLAYGTSEGVKKEWDTRGRVRNALTNAGFWKAGASSWVRDTGNHQIYLNEDGTWEHEKSKGRGLSSWRGGGGTYESHEGKGEKSLISFLEKRFPLPK